MFAHRSGASFHFNDERGAKPRLLALAVMGRVIEFALGQLIERDVHGLDPAPSLAKHISRGTAREGARVQRFSSLLRLFCPKAGVLFRRQIFKAAKQPLGESGPGLRLELQCRRLKLFDAHEWNSTPSWLCARGRRGCGAAKTRYTKHEGWDPPTGVQDFSLKVAL